MQNEPYEGPVDTVDQLKLLSEEQRQRMLVHEALHVLHGTPSTLLAAAMVEEPKFVAYAFHHALKVAGPLGLTTDAGINE